MKKEIISNKQGITMIALFVIGSSLVIGAGHQAKQDAWIAIILAILFSLPLLAIYSRILSLFPEKNVFDILENIFGKIFGKIVSIMFIWYFIHLGSLVLRNFYEFAKIVLFPETPEIAFLIFMIFLIIWVVKEGIEVLGRWTQFSIFLVITIITIITILSLQKGNINNLRPVFFEGFKPILTGAFATLTFPLGETVCFLGIFTLVKKKNNPLKIYFLGMLIGALFIFIAILRNIYVLGADLINRIYFASFTAISLINIGEFLQRIEASVAIVFFFGGFTKISVCLMAATRGLSTIFKIQNYRYLVIPAALFMMVLSIFIYESTMEMFEWAEKIYPYYAIPFQIILPLLIWIFSEIKAKNINNSNENSQLNYEI